MARTKHRPSSPGSPVIRGFTFTSPRPRHRGSTRSSVGLPRSPKSRSGEARTAQRGSWSKRSASICNSTTKHRSHSHGQRPLTRYSQAWKDFVCEFLTQDTRGACMMPVILSIGSGSATRIGSPACVLDAVCCNHQHPDVGAKSMPMPTAMPSPAGH